VSGALSLRDATPRDAEAISALVTSLVPYFLADPGRPEEAATFLQSITPDAIRGYLSGDFRYHLAEADGATVGLIGMREGSHVYHLFVDAGYHGRGIAGLLWKRALDVAREAGHTGRISVNASRYAVPVYRRFGFREAGAEVVKDGVAFLPMVREEEADPQATVSR
jgi:GNAT superfamily N-acetyltransferase